MILHNRLVLCGAIFLIAACAPIPTAQLATSPATGAPADTPSATSTPSITATWTATATPIPPTLTPLFESTLNAPQREALFRKLLSNPLCALPCWWGFTPGTSQWLEIANFLRSTGSRFGDYIYPDGRALHGSGFDFVSSGIINRINFYEAEGIVETITLHVEGYYDSAAFRQAWAAFSPDKVMAVAGPPSRVWVLSIASAPEGLGSTAPYNIWLFYDTLGFLVEYGGWLRRAPIYEMCPNFSGKTGDTNSMEIMLQSPDSLIQLESAGDFVSNSSGDARLLQDVTSLSNEDLYQLLTQEDGKPCFSTAAGIWP